MPASLKEIAEHIGVSVSTVSRVINGKDRVSPETRNKITSVLEKYDYKPNEMARVLRGKRSNTIGIIVSDISNNFFSKLIKGAEKTAMQWDYNILVCNTDSDPDREQKCVELLLSKRVASIIIASVSLTAIENQSYANGTPFVFIDNLPERSEDYFSVSIDNVLASLQLTEFLISKGHKHIAILAGSQAESTGRERLEGWKRAMTQNGLSISEQWISTGAFTIEAGYKCMTNLLAAKTRPTAVLSANNSLAYGAMLVLRQHGYSIPGDISIAAFDVDDETQLITPKFTTMNQPVLEYGRVAVEICLREAEHKNNNSQKRVILPHEFIEGESVTNAPWL